MRRKPVPTLAGVSALLVKASSRLAQAQHIRWGAGYRADPHHYLSWRGADPQDYVDTVDGPHDGSEPGVLSKARHQRHLGVGSSVHPHLQSAPMKTTRGVFVRAAP